MNQIIHIVAESSIFMKAILTCSFLGVISWLALEVSCISMIRATAHMSRSRKKWLLELKKRYQDLHAMNVKVNNPGTFVDRFFRKKKILGISSSFWIRLERLAAAGCAISGAAGALIASQQGKDLHQVMMIYLTGITAACGIFFLDTFLQPEEKQRVILTNIKDYIENVLENSLNNRRMPENDGQLEQEDSKVIKYEPRDRSSVKKEVSARPVTRAEEELLEDILQEFFA